MDETSPDYEIYTSTQETQNGNDTSDDTTTLTPQQKTCQELKKEMDYFMYVPFEIALEGCCAYPYLTVQYPSDDECKNTKCQNMTYRGGAENHITACCMWKCILENNGYLIYSTDPNIKPQTNVNGLISAFMHSKKYNDVWEPIVRTSTVKCYDDTEGMGRDDSCTDIPGSFSYTVFCSMREFFLRCPDQFWNLENMDRCENLYRPWMLECLDVYLIQ